MSSRKFICSAALAAASAFAVFADDDDNSKLDELGSTPRFWTKFENKLDSWGEETPKWDIGTKRLTFVMSRGGKAVRLSGVYPSLQDVNLSEEWTIVTIARGPEKGDGDRMIWCLGSGDKGASIALASSGATGVKLVSWKDSGSNVKIVAMKNVVHFGKQYHVYSVVKKDGGPVQLWIDGKKAGEGEIDLAGMAGVFRLGSSSKGGKVAGLALGDGMDIDDFRIYDTALTEVSQLQLASANQPWPEGLPKPKEHISAFIDTNSVLRLGYEIPEQVVIGSGGEKRLYAKGVLAQCGIGGEKRFELNPGGQFALGSGGLLFDSNYARARTNDIVFAGGTLLTFEPTFIKSAAPIKLNGDFKIKALKQLIVRAGFEGDGSITKEGPGIVGLQYPCSDAKGTLKIASPSVLVLGPAASWGGTIELCKGAVLRCVSRSQVGKIVAQPGSKVEVAPSSDRKYGDDAFPQPTTNYNMKKMQKERMGRGVYAVRISEREVMVGWRYKSADPLEIAFNVYGNGRKLNSAPIKDVTYFKTPWTGKATKYEVRGVHKGKEVAFSVSGSWTLPANAPVGYFDIELTPPPDTQMPDGKLAKHIPYDCSIGDLDGDGEYELVIIWWPDNPADNSHDHKTGDTWLEGVKLDGTNRSLWKINLGPNIRSGSHYVPVMVCDMDGDGHAEVVCRTAEGTVDGKGRIQNDAGVFNAKNTFYDWRKNMNNGHIVWAHNFVTVFDGRTGEAVDSAPFKPDVLSDAKLRKEAEERAKANTDQYKIRRDNLAVCREWPGSKRPGNPSYRMLGAVAYLDGSHPSVVMCRGYYSRTCLCAWDFDGKKLHERWFFCSDDARWWGYGGQGFHNLRVADVDFDGKDEIIYGHMVVDHDGHGLYTTGMGHGDAIQLIQGSPTMRGLQLWTCHENSPYGVSLIDAQSGRLFFWKHGPTDTGTCNAMDTDAATPGVELFSSCNLGVYSAATLEALRKPRSKDAYYATLRFGIWWNGDMTRSAYSGGNRIWNYSSSDGGISQAAEFPDVHSNHGTKGCPALSADILGDWREEIILTRNDNKALRLFMSDCDTAYRFHTFLEDPVYRISVLTQNNGYNIPTDPGFYFGPELLGHDIIFRGCQLK